MTADDTRDMNFENTLKKAYDEIEPSPEAQERMLNALKAAQAKAQNAQADEQHAQQPAHAGAVPVPVQIPMAQPAAAAQAPTSADPSAKSPRKRIAPWKVALPAAACLVLAAIGVGVATNAQPDFLDSGKTNITEQAPVDIETAPTEAMTADSFEAGGATEMYISPDYGFIDYNTEEYNALQESGFVAVATSPLSTVSADVDTASYCNLRRMINDNYYLEDIPSGSIRIEEMLNYFDYDYASPTGDDRFSIQAKVGPCPWNPDTQLLVLGFATAKETTEKPSNLVYLIDVSGSMDSPDKLPLLQDSFTTLLNHLDDDDRVSIVTYSGHEEVLLEGAKGSNDREIMRAIYRLDAGGSTNGEAGLRTAYEIAQRNYIEGGVNRIIMASDGDLNVGMTSESELYDFVQEKRKSGIYLSVLGFGTGNYKDNKMETLADNGNGQYHYIDCIEEAERVLSQDLMSNIVPFADDVKVQVEFNPTQVKGYRLIGYENREMAAEDFLDDEKDAGDIGPNAQFTVAYEIVPVGSSMEISVPDLRYGQNETQQETSAANGGTEWLNCSLRYRAFDDGKVHQQELAVNGNEGTNDDWTFAAAVIEAAMTLRGSEYAGTSSLDNALDLVKGMQLNEQRKGFVDLIDYVLTMGLDEPQPVEDLPVWYYTEDAEIPIRY